MTKALSAVRKVTKQAPKIVASALPLVSIGTNIMEVLALPDTPAGKLNNFQRRYTGYDGPSGTWRWQNFMQGSGSLIISAVVGKVVKELM